MRFGLSLLAALGQSKIRIQMQDLVAVGERASTVGG